MTNLEPCTIGASNDPALQAAASASASAAPSHKDSEPVLLHEPLSRVSNRKVTLAVCAGSALALVVVVVAGLLLSDEAVRTNFASKNMAPCLAHLFGTDWMGRDMLARTLTGLSTSVLLGLVAATASAIFALILASIAALGGKKADAVVTWLVDLVLGVPHIVLLILISFALGKGFWGAYAACAVPAVHRWIGAAVPACHSARGSSDVPWLRPFARHAGNRHHPKRVDGLPVHWRMVVGRFPGPCLGAMRSVVRFRRFGASQAH